MTETKYTKEQIRAMLGSITQGEWEADPRLYDSYVIHGERKTAIAQTIGSKLFKDMVRQAQVNATFIAAAPAIVRQLLDEIERLKAGN